ncbi:FAD-dependent oxidoreductase [Zooshikella marina]|uniref:FAD-dependent oxidoreductase n=1 Tax=Zooshikella ganghwensis TaxID=202772 RepID=UPI001BAED891|nr:FAD-dependent oxidoreductase [Zooshikella ganghwensis]MBU2706754.1 FAD-dependent oxidoreductase [Zooshikella ganghwensis]
MKHLVSTKDLLRKNIAIIGAGASGLFTAVALKEKGVQNIDIFESKSKVGGVTDTLTESDGTTVDVSNKIIDGISLTAGIKPDEEYFNFLKRYNAQFIEGKRVAFFDLIQRKELPTFKFLLENPLNTIKQIDHIVRLLKQIIPFGSDPAAAIHSGVVNPGEDLDSFCQRCDIPLFAELARQKMAAVTFSTSVVQDAASVLSYFIAFPSILFWVFAACKPTTNIFAEVDPIFSKARDDLMTGSNPYPMSLGGQGFQGVFEDLVTQEALAVHLNQPVEQLVFDTNTAKWHIQPKLAHSNAYTYDVVIIATPPNITRKLLPQDHPLVALFNNTIQPAHGRVWAISLSSSDLPKSIMENDNVYGPVLGVNIGYESLDTPFALFHTSPQGLFLCTTLTKGSSPIVDGAQAETVIQKETPQLAATLEKRSPGLTLGKVHQLYEYAFPYYPDINVAPKDFYLKLEAVQGHNNVFYISSLNAGLTMPNALAYAQKLAKLILERGLTSQDNYI